MIYLFTVYFLVIVFVFGSVFTLSLTAAMAAALFKALRSAVVSTLALWHTEAYEPFSVSKHLKSRKVLHGGAA